MTMKALIGAPSGGYTLASDIPIPPPTPGTLLIRVHAVALNPRDAKIIDYASAPLSLGGCDFAGTVEKLGQGVTRFKEGDRVLAVTFGSDATDKTKGAFAEFAIAEEDICARIPGDMDFKQACAVGLSVATAGLALFQRGGLGLGLGLHAGGGGEMVLISGGATATGTMATQLLKLAGYTPIVTCSPPNNALCTSYGAAACFNYASPGCAADIRVHTDNQLRYVLDCVTDAPTMKMCYAAIGSAGGNYIALENLATSVKYTRRDIRADWILADAIMGKGVGLKGTYGRAPCAEDRVFGKGLFGLVEGWLRDGGVRGHPVDVRGGGLEGLEGALDELKGGAVRGKKLVVPLVEAEGA